MLRILAITSLSTLLALVLSACTLPMQLIHDNMPENLHPGMSDMHRSRVDGREQRPISGMDHGEMMRWEDADAFDAQFIDGMIEHHQGAVEMARQVLEESDRAELRTLAEEIIAAQTREIEEMQEWRAAWFPGLESTAGMDMDMGAMEISPDESVPFDQRFLEAMISHHVGAIEMAEMALEVSEREEIRTLAQSIIADQKAEIGQMRGWLLDWYGIEE